MGILGVFCLNSTNFYMDDQITLIPIIWASIVLMDAQILLCFKDIFMGIFGLFNI
jgi:hypothetical protein